jgi:S1-C subfamily serine protease
MLRIVHTRGRRAPAVEHQSAPRLRVGSSPGSEIAFSPADGVAPLHAEIVFEHGAWVLVDRSGGGTFVNRARVARQPLRHGDVVMLGGGPEFRVELGAHAAPGAPDAEGRVDLETAQKIVAAAVVQATSHEGPNAAIIAARVDAATRRGARHNTLLGLGLCVVLAATGFAALMVYRSQEAAQALATESGVGKAPAATPNGTIPTRVYTGREIYEENRSALYVIGYLLPGDRIGGCCTAFAIQPNLLATNSHCVIAYRAAGGSPIVTQNDSGGKVRFKIVASTMHPGYKPNSPSADSPDVGLLRIDGKMPKTVTIASDAELRSIGPGDDVFVLGFPGRVMDPVSPSATFLQGHIGRTMGLDEQPTSPDKSVLLQHDAVTRGGNSGSPVFNQYGHVVAVHAAHLDDEDEVQMGGQKTKVVESSPFRIGMRIDLLGGVPAP